jgi:Zn-dependent peptidase ImmA (M78 family)
MIESYQRIDEQTMALVREFAQQFGCSDEIALKFLLKIGKYPQEAYEDDEAYAARLDRLPNPDVVAYRGFQAANDQ